MIKDYLNKYEFKKIIDILIDLKKMSNIVDDKYMDDLYLIIKNYIDFIINDILDKIK